MFRNLMLLIMATIGTNQILASTDSLKMVYREFGKENEKKLLIIHGFPGNANDWVSLATQLSEEFHVILPDLLGFGENSEKDLSFEELWYNKQAEVISEVLKNMGIDTISIVAHDFGVPIAVYLDSIFNGKVCSMVLSAGNTSSNPPLNPMMKAVPKPIIGGMAKAFLFSKFSINLMRTMGTKKGEVKPVKNTKLERQALKTVFATSLENMGGYFLPIEAKVNKTQTPILLIWGDKDPFFPTEHAQLMMKDMNNASLTVIEGVGHYPFLEDPSRFIDELNRFVNGN